MLYEISPGMKKVEVESKNNLPLGTVLYTNGPFENPDYVIVKNFGIDPKWPNYGAKYLRVNLSTHLQSFTNAYLYYG